MLIKRLKLSGFKSFVDPTELHIEPGLTGIVGPNGCGKSNLLEAIRWVMGENSPKSMRGGGMEDVIFAGTERRPARDFAEVTLLAERQRGDVVHLLGDTKRSEEEANDNNPLFGDGDDPELEIVRRIERDAGSAYRANGRDVRAKDVSLIFADAATGAHSPALVSQGRIAAAIAAKPTERRQMLEEAAGISGLHVRRKDAEQKLRAAETNMARLEDILADQDARAAHLQKQARAAERYKKLTEQIRTAEGRLIFARWRLAAETAKQARAEAEAAEARVSEGQAALETAQTKQNEATRALADARTAVEQARQRSSDAAHHLATLTAERDRVQARISDLQQQADRVTQDRAREDKLTHDAAAALKQLEDESEELGHRIKQVEADLPQRKVAFDNAERAVRETEVELARASADAARIEADIRVAEAALTNAQSQMADAERSAAALAEAEAALEDGNALEQQWQQAEMQCQSSEQAIGKAQADVDALAERRSALQLERQQAETDLSAARAELNGFKREHDALERDLAKRQSGSKLIDQLSADKGYERALAAALGDTLSAALADQGGDNARYWSGQASAAPDALPDGCTRLSDHVKAPAALAARLDAILVCDSDTGQPLAPGQRLVTRNGALRRWDGYAARGEQSSAAERLERANRLTELKAIIAEHEAAIGAHETALTEARTALESAQQKTRDAEAARAEAHEEHRQALRARDAADFARQRNAERLADLSERRERSASAMTNAKAALAEAEAARTALPDGAAQKQRLAEMEQQSEAMRTALQKAQAELAASDQQAAQTRERLAVIKAEIRGWQARSGEADQRLQQLTQRESEIAAEQQRIAEQPEKLAKGITEAEQNRAEIDATLSRNIATLNSAEAAVTEAETTSRDVGEALAQAREGRAAALTRSENADMRRVEMGRISGERFSCSPPLLPETCDFDEDDVGDADAESAELDRLTASRERIGPVNLVAADELEELAMETARAREEHDELITAIAELRGSIGSLNREGRARLRAAFEEVDNHFQRLFVRLFNGGKAHLAMIDSDDPLEAGLEIMAQPPGKKLASLTLLSGGEQALTAVALIFALFLTNPAPICVLDEVDAPLDDANIDRFCDLLDQMTRETDTRYLIVTHNAVTMSRMHRLFGVTMIEKGISRLVSVDLGGAEELLAAE
ncbi:MAG: chromosome segregation protein SMC [Pseudomonadota bacterium]